MIEAFLQHWPETVVTLIGVISAAVIGGVLTEVGPWYESLNFPRPRPPNWLFAPAWTVIYCFITAAAILGWNDAEGSQRTLLVWLFAINWVVNVVWSPLFFKLKRPDWALYELVPFWLSVLALVIALFSISSRAGWLILPYLLWVTFAAWLNWRVVVLNRPFGRDAPSSRTPVNDGRAF